MPLFHLTSTRCTDPVALQGLVHPLPGLNSCSASCGGRDRRPRRASPSCHVVAGLGEPPPAAAARRRVRRGRGRRGGGDRRRGGRERWWRAAARSTTSSPRRAPRMRPTRWCATTSRSGPRPVFGNARAWLATSSPSGPRKWQQLDDFSDIPLSLTVDEVRQLDREIAAVLARDGGTIRAAAPDTGRGDRHVPVPALPGAPADAAVRGCVTGSGCRPAPLRCCVFSMGRASLHLPSRVRGWC